MKRFLKGFGVFFLSLGIIVYTVCMFEEPDLIPVFLIMDLLFAFFIFLILRKRNPKPHVDSSKHDVSPAPEVKKNVCDCCGLKLHGKPIQISDGGICGLCNTICTRSPMTTVDNVKAAWGENKARVQIFNPNITVNDFGSGSIFIDTANRMACISNSKKFDQHSIVFKFSELEEYRIEKVGEKTITKTKGGITRAVVGNATFGLAGAIVGASTAKQETVKKGGVSVLYLDLNQNGLKTTISIAHPPLRTTEFLNNIIDEK